MTRLALILGAAALLGASGAFAAHPVSSNPPPKEAASSDADLVLPLPHGSPKELATGATRGISLGVRTRAETVTDVQPADTPTGARSGPRSLTGAPRP